MKPIRIVADSSCDLLSLDNVDFSTAPLFIRTETEEFRDDASLDIPGMIRTLQRSKGRSFTSCPNITEWEAKFGSKADVIAFTITGGLSGSYYAACIAKQSWEERNPGHRIHIIDTLSAGPEIVLLIEKAAELIRRDFSCDAVYKVVRAYQERTHLLFALESLHNLAQNGRVSKVAATMAGVLGIRTIGKASNEGTLSLLGKCRGIKRTMAYILERMNLSGYGGGKVRIGHCQNGSGAENLRDLIIHNFPSADVKVYPLRGLCSYYAEQGGLMIGYESLIHVSKLLFSEHDQDAAQKFSSLDANI